MRGNFILDGTTLIDLGTGLRVECGGTPAPPATPPTGTGWRHITNGAEDTAATTPTAAEVSAAASSHTHAASDVTGTAVVTNDARLSDARTPTAHVHAPGDVTGTAVVTADARLSDARTPLAHVHAAADVTGTAVLTADARLSDARTPTAHAASHLSSGADKLVAATAATPATTGTMTVTMNALTDGVVTITPTGACTFNASGGKAGARCTFVITTSGTSSFVLTFGTNFKAAGTLATGTTTAKVFAVSHVCKDGTLWVETGRTVAM